MTTEQARWEMDADQFAGFVANRQARMEMDRD